MQKLNQNAPDNGFPLLYLLSGICADERLFQFLHLEHPNPRFLRWISPAPEDTMASYAAKMIQQLEPGQEPPVLVGLSFGGMMVQEMAKQIPVKRLILLSSLTDTRQLPLHYRLAGSLQLERWMPLHLFKKWVKPAYWLFGAHSPKEKKILRDILLETDIPLLRWSLHQILSWRHQASAENTIVLHGDRDKILSLPQHHNLIVLPGGEHLMVMRQAQELSVLVNLYLK